MIIIGKFTDRTGEIRYNNQNEKMIIIAYRNAKDIDIQFEDGIIVYNRDYDKFKIGRIKHPIRYEESFSYHIEVELGLNLDDIWNWEKNNELGINPYEITKCSNKKVWLYCQEKDYHNDYGGYEITCSHFYRGHRCGYCSSRKIHPKDSLAYNYPNIAKMIAIEENNLTFEDCYNIACYSNKCFYFKCLNCDTISNRKYSLNQITKYKYSCKICNDGLSIPEKIINNIFKQLDIKAKHQLSKKDFNWCNIYLYDFYIKHLNMIIETHGKQHYEECSLTKRTLEEEKMNDLFKYKCAKGHVDNYIIIDCRYSTLEWLKENIIKELGEYFDLSNINWELAWEQSQKSKCIEAWELWNNGIHSTVEIGKILNLNYTTILKYLKNGVKCNKCNYTKEEARRVEDLKRSGKNNYLARKIICITTNEIFDTITEGAKYHNIKSASHIISCCKGKYKSAGKLEDGTKLVWMYYEDYLKYNIKTERK